MMRISLLPDDEQPIDTVAPPRKRRRWRRIAAYAGLGLLLLFAVGTIILRSYYNGKALANTVEQALQGSIRGRVQVGDIRWPLLDISKLVTGGWLHVEVEDLKVWDEYEDLVIEVPRATLEIDVHGAMGLKTFRMRHILIKDGGYALIKSVPEPYPAHEYDTSVVSLISAFYSTRSPGFATGYSARKRSTFDLREFEIAGEGVTLDFEFGDTKARVEKVVGSGFLYSGGNDPLGGKLYYSLAATQPDGTPQRPTRAEKATITRPDGMVVNLSNIKVERMGQMPSRWPSELVPRDIQFKITADGEDGMKVDVEGALLDAWIDIFGGEFRMTVKLDRAGTVARMASQGYADGDYLKLTLDMDGPKLAPRFKADVRNVDLHIPMGEDREPLELEIDRAVPSWDLATDSGSMRDVIARVKDGVGHLELAANFQLQRPKPMSFDLQINIPEAIDLRKYAPEKFISVANGTMLSGRLSAVGDKEKQKLEQLDLRFGEAAISGTAFKQGSLVHAEGVHVDLPGLDIKNIAGQADMQSRDLDLVFDINLSQARRYLRLFDVQPLVRTVRGRVRVDGTIEDPAVHSRGLVITGVPYVGRVEMTANYEDETVALDNVEATSFGGWIQGSGKFMINGLQLADVQATATNLHLDELPLIGYLLKGELDLQATASGSARRPDAKVKAKLSNWSLAGERFNDTEIQLEASRNGDRRVEGTLERERGGVLHVDALVDRASRLAGIFSLRDLPLDSLLAHGSGKLPKMGGSLSTELQLGGTTEAPTVEGQVTLLRSWIQRAFLGTADFQIEEVGDSEVRITGHVFQRRIGMDILLSTAPPYRTEIQLSLKRIELDRFAPELAQQFGVRGWVSGSLDYKGSLLGKDKPMVHASLTEAEIIIDNEDENGRPSPIRLRNRSALNLSYDGVTLAFLDEATIQGPTGDFTLAGSGTREDLDFTLEGGIAVKTVQPYMQAQFEEMSGFLQAKAKLGGTIDDYRVVGVVEIEDVRLKPTGQDAIVTVPSGKIDFSNSQLSVTGLRVVVEDQFSDDVSELTVGGGLRLENFEPAMWAMRIEGELAGKMLLVLAPKVFSAASGTADVSVALLGAGATPDIDGTIEFDSQTPLSLTPRAARREVSLTSGLIRFTDQLIELEDIQGTVDGEGQLTAVNGEISLEEWQPVDVDVSVSARDLLYRLPQELELSVHLNGFSVLGGVEGLEIAGQIEIADGRYIKKFNPFLDALQPTRSTDSEGSIFEDVPLLGNARLKLAVMSRAFFVDNNVGNIEFNGEVDITGTPLEPEIDGVIHVAQGSFKFQGIRARFERTSGSVRFSPGLPFPEETPYLSIASESDFRATDGQPHLVNLRIEGPLSKLDVDLGTSAGLNKTETLQLIVSGRTSEDVRKKLLGDEAIGRDTLDNKSTASSDNGLQALDQFTKDIAGDWFSLIIEDKLRAATKLDVARLQVGTASIGFYGEKVLTESWKFVGEIERSLSGWNWDLQTQYRFSDDVSLDLGYLEKYFDDEADEDESRTRLRTTFRDYWVP